MHTFQYHPNTQYHVSTLLKRTQYHVPYILSLQTTYYAVLGNNSAVILPHSVYLVGSPSQGTPNVPSKLNKH